MSTPAALTSIGQRVAIETGYPAVFQFVINTLVTDQRLNISDGATVERGVQLRGQITLGPGSRVSSGSQLVGDVTLAEGGYVGPNSRIEGHVSVGRGTNLNEEVEVLAAEDETISIGKYDAIARRTTFQDQYHVTSKPGMQVEFYREKVGEPLGERSNGPIRVGNDVWIGLNTIVLSGVDIGHGAVVGAGSIVTRDVSPYSVVAGIPAERIGWRFDEQVRRQLLDIEWWEWDDETIRRNSQFFRTDLTEITDIDRIIER